MKCACGSHRELQSAGPSTRVVELSRTEPMRGRRRGMHGRQAVPAVAHRVRGAVPGSGPAWGLPPRPLPPRPAPLLRTRAARAHPRAALLPVRQPRVRGASAPDLRARLCLLRARARATLLPRALRRLRAQPSLQVRAWARRGRGWRGWMGPSIAYRPPTAPRRPRLLAFQAFCSPAPSSPDRCQPDQAPNCLRAYAGLMGTHCRIRRGRGSSRLPPPGWTDYSVLWVPAGTAVTPNYLDNVSARVAPWCHCGVSGNRQEECEAFRGLFTRNRCLGEGPGRGGAGRRRSRVCSYCPLSSRLASESPC